MPENKYDIIIAGGGLAGLAMRLALINTPWRVLHLQNEITVQDGDNRGMALARSSRAILQRLGVWPNNSVAEIRRIKISMSGQFGTACINDKDLDGGALGYVVRARALMQLLRAAVPQPITASLIAVRPAGNMVQVEAASNGNTTSYSSSLFIAADGTNSTALRLAGSATRPKPYPHSAIVCELHGNYDDRELAVEHLTPDGPVAVLPLSNNRSKLVYCVRNEICKQTAAMEQRDFINTLMAATEYRLPQIRHLGPRSIWPLCRQRHNGTGRILPIGNAAMTVHPNAAQGYNLCLRDIAHFADYIDNCTDPGDTTMLSRWHGLRRADRDATERLTGILASFYSPRLMPTPLYGLGLMMVDFLPSLKRHIAWHAAGLAATQLPDTIYASAINDR